MLNGFLLKFCGPLGVGEELPVVLAVVLVDTVGGVMLTTGVEVATLLTTGVEVGLALLTIDVEVGLALLATSVEVGLGLLTIDVEVGLSLLTTGVGVVGVLVPPTIIGGNITWLLMSAFVCLWFNVHIYEHTA